MIAVQNRPRPWKVYEVDPMTCPKCGGSMKVVAFLTDFSVVDRIIGYFKTLRVLTTMVNPDIIHLCTS